ncbi:hypothetical protein [Motiliproteus sediminis]|uniref:hypothetical protein n=1 Tax=Motiliproteus sediminis TaxID=1468178 RepID=UPI001AEF4D9D|nr:hypothetical protein [Motiliproteus sediminis]
MDSIQYLPKTKLRRELRQWMRKQQLLAITERGQVIAYWVPAELYSALKKSINLG